jgi:hypothetical protein
MNAHCHVKLSGLDERKPGVCETDLKTDLGAFPNSLNLWSDYPVFPLAA